MSASGKKQEEATVDSARTTESPKPNETQGETWPAKVGGFCGLLTAFVLWKTALGGGLGGALIAAFTVPFLSIPFIIVFSALAAGAKGSGDTAAVHRGAPPDGSPGPSTAQQDNSQHENKYDLR